MSKKHKLALTPSADKLPGIKHRGKKKLERIPIKIALHPQQKSLHKPAWLRTPLPSQKNIRQMTRLLAKHQLHTVCQEAHCPNLEECFNQGTATFMIMGDICTRRCPFCDVAHGRPLPLMETEPLAIAQAVQTLKLKYVVITSVNRDDLRDGGAYHFVRCIDEIRRINSTIKIEVLIPDFRGRTQQALRAFAQNQPDILNHNIETVPDYYRKVRPGACYQGSLSLLKEFKQRWPTLPTKSGIMLGLGETIAQVIDVMHDMRTHHVDMITLGQYLQPTRYHLPVERYVPPEEFDHLALIAKQLGFKHVASGPLVRSSYHAEQQANGNLVSE